MSAAPLPPPAPAGIIPSLDGIRAFAVGMVFVAHAGLSPLIPGGFGVTIFFFLSGFLITSLLIIEHRTHGTIALPAFFARRLVRLMPPLLVTLLAGYLLVVAGLTTGQLDPMTFVSQIFFFYNYFAMDPTLTSSVPGFSLLWSLSVEEHFYLIWPFAFIAIARGWIGLRTVLVVLVLILCWRFWRLLVWENTAWAIYSLTDTRFDSLLYGCLLAFLVDNGKAARLFPNGTIARLSLLLGAIAVLVLTLAVRDPTFRSTFRYSVQGLALMPIFYYAVTRPDLLYFRWLNWAWVRRIGVLSYTLYLSHFVIIGMLQHIGLQDAGKFVFIVAAAAASLGWKALAYELIERPLKPIRARLSGHATQLKDAKT